MSNCFTAAEQILNLKRHALRTMLLDVLFETGKPPAASLALSKRNPNQTSAEQLAAIYNFYLATTK